MLKMSQLKPAYEPIPPIDERKAGLNRWQYLVVLSLALLLLKFWPSRFELYFGIMIASALVLLSTLSRLWNIGRSVFSLANWAYAIAGFIVLQLYPSYPSRYGWVGLAASAMAVLTPYVYLPPMYEIYRQMDLPGFLLITLLFLLAGGFTFWCYQY
jgi:hypothetical protein